MDEEKTLWLERVEAIIHILEGSTISELELTEAGTEIIVRRNPGMVMVSSALTQQTMAVMQNGQSGTIIQPVTGPTVKVDKSVAIAAPLTGVYYEAASPTSPSFTAVGDIVRVGQVIALIEAMKVFNEIQADVSGRVVAMVATSGNVIQKGDVLLRIEPL
ncbi:MAG: acetyl-CoA carboxylase biotin carboxyl carrier protein [Ktedonobacteraceae bacterium]